MAQPTNTARRPRPYLEMANQTVLEIDTHSQTYRDWLAAERARTQVSLRDINQQQEFLVRALIHGLELGLIRTAELRALSWDTFDEAENQAAGLAYQSGALDSYEAL